MTTFRPIVLLLLAMISAAFELKVAHGQVSQNPERCSGYNLAVKGGLGGSVPVVPSNLLSSDIAVPCLVTILERLDGSVALPIFRPEIRSQFLSATGALRSIISAAVTADQSAKNNKNLSNFIRKFRILSNLAVTRVLVYAVRSDDSAARANALLILANVIDNRTVCVAIDLFI